MLRVFRLIVKVTSCSSWPWYITYKGNSSNRILHLKSTLRTLCSGVGNLMQCRSLYVISWEVTCTLKMFYLTLDGEIGELVQSAGKWGLSWGLFCGTSGRRELCMSSMYPAIVIISMGFRPGEAKWCRDALKSSIGLAMQATKGNCFYREEGFFTM